MTNSVGSNQTAPSGAGESGFMILLSSFVCVDALRPDKYFFSHVRKSSCLPGLNQCQVEAKVSCLRTQDFFPVSLKLTK